MGVVGWWVVVGGIGVQTQLHVKPNSVELERTLAMRCEVGCVLPLVIFVHLEDKKWKKPLPGCICGWHFQLTHKIAKSEKS